MAAAEGKNPCDFSGYRLLAEKALRMERSINQLLSVHRFNFMCWNLAARSVSVGHLMYVLYDHITWEGDKCIRSHYLTGSCARHRATFHSICGRCWTPASDHIMVFNGYNSENRCFQWLLKLLGEISDEEQLQLGVEPKEFGLHSFRKGVCTLSFSFMSGRTPITSIILRNRLDAASSVAKGMNEYYASFLHFSQQWNRLLTDMHQGLPLTSAS